MIFNAVSLNVKGKTQHFTKSLNICTFPRPWKCVEIESKKASYGIQIYILENRYLSLGAFLSKILVLVLFEFHTLYYDHPHHFFLPSPPRPTTHSIPTQCCILRFFFFKPVEGWRGGSEVESTSYSGRGPGFHSQNPHGSTQPSVTPVSYGDTLFYFLRSQAQWYVCWHTWKQTLIPVKPK